MCGISAIAGQRDVAGLLLECLRNLEYRGYDSCGMAIFENGKLNLRKNIGGVDEVNDKEMFQEMHGSIGVAHTRWATHGGVTRLNSHPHFSNDQQFVIVHNGIFSNYQKLREELKEQGFQFYSETDTEVFANLVQSHYRDLENVEEAFLKAVKQLAGSYAIAMVSTHDPEKIYAVKKDSPLVLGLSDGANYVSSDINAFVSHTKETVLLNDNEYCIVTNRDFQVKTVEGQEEVKKEIITINWDQQTSQKGGFAHFMLKEIFDQPQTIRNVVSIADEDLEPIVHEFLNKKQSFLVGVGTTYYVAMVGTYLFSKYAGMYIPAVSSDELPSLVPLNQENHVLVLSQSGETYDSRMALKYAQENGSSTSGVVNVVGSSISQIVDHCVFQASGPEICVVSTKAALSQMLIIHRIALKVGVANGTISAKEGERIEKGIYDFSNLVEQILNEQSGFIRNLASETSDVKNWLFMGKGIYYPIAMESALKMKEITYLHAEGLSAGFLKHGTLAMIDESLFSLFFLPPREEEALYHSTLMAIEEVKARKGIVVGFCSSDDEDAKNLLDHSIQIPNILSELTPFLEMIMAQLFSYYSALHLKRNIDKPRNLAKSVTVG